MIDHEKRNTNEYTRVNTKTGKWSKTVKWTFVLTYVAWVGVAATPGVAQAATTIDQIKNRGYVECGVTDRKPGFSDQNMDGRWSGFYVDFCRAAAAAVLGNGDAVRIENYWLSALKGGEVDVLHAGSTWTLGRDTVSGFDFPGVYFIDGQGFIAHSQLGVKTLKDAMALPNLKVCAIGPSSTAITNINDFIATNSLSWEVVTTKTMDGMWRAFFGLRCDLAIHDRASLVAVYIGRLKSSKDFIVLPEVISKEPLAPTVRDDDPQWRDLVQWITFVTIAAEERGITRANVDTMVATSTSPEIRRLLGVDAGLGKGFGLDDAWAYRVIKEVGNYAEIFARNLGAQTKINMARGLNRLARDGGVMYAPPIL